MQISDIYRTEKMLEAMESLRDYFAYTDEEEGLGCGARAVMDAASEMAKRVRDREYEKFVREEEAI